jgi:hypothetical protein
MTTAKNRGGFKRYLLLRHSRNVVLLELQEGKIAYFSKVNLFNNFL